MGAVLSKTTYRLVYELFRLNHGKSENQNAENHICRKGTWPVTDGKQHHKLDDGPCFSCSQCDKKFNTSDDVHSVIRNLPCLMSFILI